MLMKFGLQHFYRDFILLKLYIISNYISRKLLQGEMFVAKEGLVLCGKDFFRVFSNPFMLFLHRLLSTFSLPSERCAVTAPFWLISVWEWLFRLFWGLILTPGISFALLFLLLLALCCSNKYSHRPGLCMLYMQRYVIINGYTKATIWSTRQNFCFVIVLPRKEIWPLSLDWNTKYKSTSCSHISWKVRGKNREGPFSF